MFEKFIATASKVAVESARFFVPTIATKRTAMVSTQKAVAVLIPTHVPNDTTYDLIKSILTWHPEVLIVVIDDCTPLTPQNKPILNQIATLAKSHKNLINLRTPKNTLKAGALNFGLDYIMSLPKKPHVIFTFDDDVTINQNTIPYMVDALYSENEIGAVCSQVRVKNKNDNMLTRLQALEYHNFNITKIADNGFLKGPLVMQGMLSAFRTHALIQINGYTHGHLIEDYEITARLKSVGWKVKIAQKAVAWTTVPDTIESLWKQRVRWTSGGLHVVKQFLNNIVVVYQDVVGHSLFLSLLFLIILSFIFARTDDSVTPLTLTLLFFAVFNFIIAFGFNLASMFLYSDRDKKDWIIKFTVLPELIYSNILSLVLIGSYLFFIVISLEKPLLSRFVFLKRPYAALLSVFNKIGFSTTWGTRQEKGGVL